MKTNHPFHSSRTHWATALLIAGTAALQLSTIDLFAPPPGAGKGKATAVKVTLLDSFGERIRSDGKGPYTHGVDKVTAVIHDSGQFELETGYSSLKRRVSLDYGVIVSGTACAVSDAKTEVPDLNCNALPDDPLSSTLRWARLSTQGLNLLSIAAGGTSRGGFFVRFTDGCPAATHVPWSIAFQVQVPGALEYYCPCSAQVVVEAFNDDPDKGVPGTGVDKWIIMIEASATSGAEGCFLSGGSEQAVLREIVRMPFHLVVALP